MVAFLAAACILPQGPVQIGIFGDVRSPGQREIPRATWAEVAKVFSQTARPRVTSSQTMFVLRASGKIERVTNRGQDFVLQSDDGLGEFAPPATGDMVYVPSRSEAVVVEKGQAHFLSFDGPTTSLREALGKAETPKSVCIPRFFERFQAPDLVSAPKALVFNLIAQIDPPASGAKGPTEPLRWISETDDIIHSGDLVIVEEAEPFADASKAAKEAGSDDWLRTWMPPLWEGAKPFKGSEPNVPISRRVGDEVNSNLAFVGPYDLRAEEPVPYRLFAQTRPVVSPTAARPMNVVVDTFRRKSGRFEVERIDRTRIFVWSMETGKLASVELNDPTVRSKYDYVVQDSSFAKKDPVIEKENERRQDRLRGARVIYRIYPISFSNFIVDLGAFGTPADKLISRGLWTESGAAIVHHEQDYVDLAPKSTVKKASAAAGYLVYSAILKPESATSTKRTVKLQKLNIKAGDSLVTKIASGALVFKAGGK